MSEFDRHADTDLYAALEIPLQLRDDPLVIILVRTCEQLLRLGRLADYAESDVRDAEIRNELLRGLVVFAHATLEDSIREAVRRRWRDWPDETIEKLPFQDRNNRITHLDLKKHATLRVEELIEQSANEFLDRKSFSSASDVCSMLRNIQIDLGKELEHELESLALNGWAFVGLAALQAMIERRHNIVHNGDYHRDTHTRNSIEIAEVFEWIFTVAICVLIVIDREAQRCPEFPIVSESVSRVVHLLGYRSSSKVGANLNASDSDTAGTS